MASIAPDGRPGCDYCAERLRVNLGLIEENRQLRRDGVAREDVRSALQELRRQSADGFVSLDKVEARLLRSDYERKHR